MNRAPARRGQRPPWAMIVGLAVIAVLTVTILAVLVLGNPPADASSTATPSPSATVSAKATATGTEVPSPTATEAAAPSAPELPQGLLPPGAVVTVATEMLRIRSEPSLSSDVVAKMSAGDLAYVENAIDYGPVRADGFAWYRVAYARGRDVWPFQDAAPAGYVTGWMASGDNSGPYIELADISCPAGAIDLEILANTMTPWERLVCIGSRTVTVKGRYGCDGCGGVVPGAKPSWLADLSQAPPIAARGDFYPAVSVAVPPAGRPPANGDVIRATLHVDDPAAATCRYQPPSDSAAAAYRFDPGAVRVFCRERLVLESFVVTGHDSFP